MRVLSLCLLLFMPAVAIAGIGVFTEVAGEVRLQRGEVYFAGAAGVDVEEDDIVETGSNASAQLEMNDGTLFKLGAGSRMLLADYRFDNGGNLVSAGLDVLSGWLRFAITSLRANDSRFAISTPTMTIGIRGTEGVIEAGNAHAGLFLEEGEVAVHAADTASVPVRAGEYVERAHGRPFVRPGAVPPAFRARMPSTVQPRMARRAQLLKQRGVTPRQVRRLEKADRERYMQQHPHLRQKFEQRFRERGRSDPAFREKLKERRRQPPQHREQPPRRPQPDDAAPVRP